MIGSLQNFSKSNSISCTTVVSSIVRRDDIVKTLSQTITPYYITQLYLLQSAKNILFYNI